MILRPITCLACNHGLRASRPWCLAFYARASDKGYPPLRAGSLVRAASSGHDQGLAAGLGDGCGHSFSPGRCTGGMAFDWRDQIRDFWKLEGEHYTKLKVYGPLWTLRGGDKVEVVGNGNTSFLSKYLDFKFFKKKYL